MAKVVRPARELGTVLLIRQGSLTRLLPRPPVGDGGQRPTLDPLEERICPLTRDHGEVVAEQSGQPGRAWDTPRLTFGSVFEASTVAPGPVISPPTACVGPGGCQVEFTPWIVGLTPLAAFLVPDQRWQLDQDDEPTSWAELSIVPELASGATVGELVRGLAKAMLIAMGDRISAGRGGNHRRTPPGQLHPPGS